MLVRAEKACFIGGSRRKPGAIFEYDGKPALFLTPIEDQVDPEPLKIDVMPDDELRVKLAECGVKVRPNATREQMDALLADVEGKKE